MQQIRVFSKLSFKRAMVGLLVLGLVSSNAYTYQELNNVKLHNAYLEASLEQDEAAFKDLANIIAKKDREVNNLTVELQGVRDELGTIKSRQPVKFEATAYTSLGDTESWVTATGTYVDRQTIAVDPSIIPLGSKVKVTFPERPEYNGIYYARDTGGAIQGHIIDIWVESNSEALDFGRRHCYIEVL